MRISRLNAETKLKRLMRASLMWISGSEATGVDAHTMVPVI